MDSDDGRIRTPVRRPAPGQGGTVEPANRAPIAIDRFQTPIDVPGERYELRDPFAEVTYRANSLPEIVAKADQLGSSRFTAIDTQGARRTVQKVDGQWERGGQRGAQRAALPERPLDATPIRDDGPQPTNVVPIPRSAAQPEAAVTQSIAKIDAQAERAAQVARLEAALVSSSGRR